MSLDQRTTIIAQISAAAACNALVALRLAITEGLAAGFTKEDIEEVIRVAKDIQQQPISHMSHLTHQMLRDSKKKPHHEHSAHCGCNNHHT